MNLPHRINRWLKPRFFIMYPLGIYLILFANSDDHSIRQGIWFILSGLAIRIWANGYAIKLEKLTTSGPYAYVRHPLYLGSILVMVGFMIMLKIYLLGGLFLAGFLFVYAITMRKEEEMLVSKFGKAYVNYRMEVPAVFPRFQPYVVGEKWPFSFQRLLQSQEYKLSIWMIISVIAFHLKDEFMVEREAPDLKIWLLIATILILASSDVVIDFYRKKAARQAALMNT